MGEKIRRIFVMGIIFWVIILAIIISSSSKKNKDIEKKSIKPSVEQKKTKNTNRASARQRETTLPTETKTSYESQQELKERLSKKYRKPSEVDILQKAKETVKEEFSSRESLSQNQKELEKRVAEKLAEQKTYTEKDGESVLHTVRELMVKGPSTDLAFERDFLAEGMEMLNRSLQ